MCDICESEVNLSTLSADGSECSNTWNTVVTAAHAAVRRIPFDLWQPGFVEALRLVRSGFTPQAECEWQPQHYHHLGVSGHHDIHLGVDGQLYKLTPTHHACKNLWATDFLYADMLKLGSELSDYFKPSDVTEALYVAIEQELARLALLPRPKLLGVGHKKHVVIDIPMPGDGSKLIRRLDGGEYFGEYLRVWQLPYADYSVDDRGRLFVHSAKHHILALVHLRSIMKRADLQKLLSGLQQTV